MHACAMWRTIIVAAAFCALALGQSSTLPPVPHGTPIPGNYSGQYRPQVHFSPPVDFMNDPNGLFVDDDGTWHMYYQCMRTLLPGSAVVDRNNTSGFFPTQDNGVVAIFTIATYEPVLLQSQGIAYSHDGGYSFELYEGNPVLDIGSSQFRDPKVIWYEDHWVMAIAYAADFVIGVYSSPDLKNWAHSSNFSHYGLLGIQYECPNLVEVPIDDTDETMWLLQISINPGSPQGGSSSQYFLGDFDGYTFSPRDNVTRVTDFAKDAYAGQFWSNLPMGEAVSINWASNWQYVQVTPTGQIEGWRSSMAIPRRISVRNLDLVGYTEIARPYDLTPIVGETLASQRMGNGSFAVDYASSYSQALWLSVNITNLPPSANLTSGTVNMTFLSPISGEYLRAGMYLGNGNYFFVDRSGTRGFDNVFFTDKFAASQTLGNSLHFDVIIDRSLFETFVNDGASSSTTSFYSTMPLTLLSFGSSDMPADASVSAVVYELKSTWQPQENELGTVVGNVTQGGSGTKRRRHPQMLYGSDVQQ
ncbi:MAG: hypothetical protein Q9162_003418 [Coniocarpon cinnabarinum]